MKKFFLFSCKFILIEILLSAGTLFAQSLQPTRHIPLIESPCNNNRGYYTILFTGNGGWQHLVKSVTHYLNTNDISVVAINTKKYLLAKKEPQQIACDLESIIDHYNKKWDEGKVILMGYSMGAEILPFATNRFDSIYRKDLLDMVLIGPWQKATFRTRLADYFFKINKGADVYSELMKMKDERAYVICDDTKLSIKNKNLDGVVDHDLLTGGHHFGHDYASLTNLIGKRLQLEE